MMMYDESFTDKKRQKNLLAFLQNGKHHFLNSMGYSTGKRGSLISKGIFGAPLKPAAFCGSSNEIGLTVPEPVYRCFEEIMKRGLLTEGIFRLSGAAPEVESLLLDFDKPPTYGKYLDLKNNDIHAITGVVKKFLRQLPDPAIPIASHEKFIQLYDESFSEKSTIINTLATLIRQLPREHYHLVHYIILLTSKIQKHADVNMMNPEALAIVLAPVCTGLEQNLKEIPSWVKRHTRAKMMNDMGHFIATNAKWTRIWTLLIEYSDTLLENWKQLPLPWIVPPGRNTVPCHPPSSYSNITSHSRCSLTPSFEQAETELMLNIVPPLPKRRPSTQSHKSTEELYKVVVMRSRQNTTCRSLKKKNSRRVSLLMEHHSESDKDDSSSGDSAPVMMPRHSNSTTTVSTNSSRNRHSIISPSINTRSLYSNSSINISSSITAD